MNKLNLIEQLNKQLIIAIHCADLQQADVVLSFAADLGYKIDITQSPLILKNKWKEHKDHTVYFLNNMYKNVVCGHLETADKLGYTIYTPSDFEELVNREFVNQVANFLHCNPQAQTELQQVFNSLVGKYNNNNNLMQLTPILKNLEKQLNCFSLQMELYNDDTMLSIDDADERLNIEIELESGFINFNVYEPIDIKIVQIVLDFQKQLLQLN